MVRIISGIALLVLSHAHIVQSADADRGQVLLKETFDSSSDDSGFAAKVLENEFIELAESAGPDGSDAIRVAYVGYERGSHRVLGNYPLRKKVDQATLSFDVCFEKNFQWTFGGKLHGLGPECSVTGGGERRPSAWSARMMFKQNGRCSTYLYDQNTANKWGAGNTTAKPVFVASHWHHVDLQVSLNDPGKPNGLARILIDGKPVVATENVVFRGVGGSDTRIQYFLFSTFHGGNAPKWTPLDEKGKPTTVHALFDNLMVTEGIQFWGAPVMERQE